MYNPDEKKPVVSIIMPTYNCADYIGDAIDSVIAQTYGNWELIIVDDHSDDKTEEVVNARLSCGKIRYIYLDEQLGPAGARNRGLDAADGEFAAFLDSDDLWTEEKLAVQIEFMEKNGADFTCTSYEIIGESGDLRGKVSPPRSAGYNRIFYCGNTVGNSTAMYRRSAFPGVRVPDIRKRNDFALWLRLTKNGAKCLGLQQCLAKYRVRENSVSSSKRSLFRYQWMLYRNIEGHPVIVCCLAFVTLALCKTAKKLSLVVSKA